MPFVYIYIYTSNLCCFAARYCSDEVEYNITLQIRVRFAGSSLDGTVSAGIYTNVSWPNNIFNYTNMEGNITLLIRGTPDAKFQPH